MESTLQALGHSLEIWQGLYIVAIILAVLSTFSIVLFNFHLTNHQHGLRASNYVYAIAACLSVIATLVIITKTRSFDSEKDRLSEIKINGLQRETAMANASAAKANADAKSAYQKAEEARLKAEQTAAANLGLRIEVTKQETETKKATSDLAKQNQQTAQFAQGLAQQQQGMAQQMQATPSLSESQTNIIADRLKPFAGQKIAIHTMSDARCQRLGAQIHKAALQANLNVVEHSTDFGPNYTGVAVGVKKVAGHPPMADVLINAIQSVGVPVRGGLEPSLPDDVVGIFIGPE